MIRVLAGLAILLSTICLSTGVSAHASLVSTEPSDASVLTQAPKSVQLRFNEPVAPADIKLIDAAGRLRDDALVSAHEGTIEIGLPDGLPVGTQIISYRVFSADGHPVGGSLVFSIGMPSGTTVPPTNAAPEIAVLIWLARIGVYVGLFVGIGGAFFDAWIARSAASAITVALVIGLFSAVTSLGLQGLDLRDLPLDDAFTSVPWKAAAATSLFSSLLISVAAMTAALIARQSKSARVRAMLSVFAIAGVGLSLATSGHASTAPPQWLTRPMLFLHGIGVAFWIGALAPLIAMVWKAEPYVLAGLYRFSRAAVVVVGLLVLTGLGLAIVQLGSFPALIETKYGLILSIKLALVALMLGFAALNRFRLTPGLVADPDNTRPLLRSMLAECVVGMAILAAVAGWRFAPPPRALAAIASAPLAIHMHTASAILDVQVSPGTVGSDRFVVQLMDSDGAPLTPKEVTLALSLPERGIEPFERKATLGADGNWYVSDVPIGFSGRWHLRVEALVTDFRKVSLEGDFAVPAR